MLLKQRSHEEDDKTELIYFPFGHSSELPGISSVKTFVAVEKDNGPTGINIR